MQNTSALVLLLAVTAATTACGRVAAEEVPGGNATAAIDGTTYAVSDVKLTFQTGYDGHFRIEGRDATHSSDDCVPGLDGGLALYGELPAGVKRVADLRGLELPVQFTGDGDDFNLCFVGSNGLLGVDNGAVRFLQVDGNSVTFNFSGTFDRFDGKGGKSGNVRASGSGTATIE